MNQISEKLLTAIDIVVQDRLKNLSYDKTELCTIIEKLSTNKYLVEHKGLSFTVYGDAEYLIGEQVYVTSPQNDSYSNKIIIGKYIKESTTLSTVSLIDNLILYNILNIDQELSIDRDILQETNDYVNLPSHFGIGFNINAAALSKASFQLQINLYNKDGEVAQTEYFTEKDILGNLEQLTNSHQEKLFALNLINEISKIELKLTATNFITISLSNIKLFFGNHIKNYSTPGLYINTINSLKYKKENNNKSVYCSFLKQSNSGGLYKETTSDFSWEEYIITSYLTEDMAAAWGAISSNEDNHSFIFNVEKYPYKKIRAVNNSQGLISNILTFVNEDKNAPVDIFDKESVLGTEYELIVEMSTKGQDSFPKNIFTKGYGNYILYAELRDKYSNAEIINSNDTSLQLTYTLELNINNTINNQKIIVSNSNSIAYGILRATATYLNKTYVSYVSLGWRNSVDYHVFQGATAIIYNNNGTEPTWNQSAYALYENANNISGLDWYINKQGVGYPTLTDNKLLKPYNSYVNNLSKDIYIQAKKGTNIIWIQPIILIKELFTQGNTGSTNNIANINSVILSALKSDEGGLNGAVIGETNDQKIGLFLLQNGSVISQITSSDFQIDNNNLKFIGDTYLDTDYVLASKKYVDEQSSVTDETINNKVNNAVGALNFTTIDQVNNIVNDKINNLSIPSSNDIKNIVIEVLQENGII